MMLTKRMILVCIGIATFIWGVWWGIAKMPQPAEKQDLDPSIVLEHNGKYFKWVGEKDFDGQIEVILRHNGMLK